MANRFLSNIRINDAYTFPASDGTAGQVIGTDGAGNLSFVDQQGADGATLIFLDTFTGDGVTTDFTLSQNVDNEVKTFVYFDGVYQEKDTYEVSTTTITFSTAPPSGTSMEVVIFLSVAAEDYNQKLLFYGKATGTISKGDAVMFAGAEGDHFLFAKATQAAIEADHELFIGLANQDFADNEFGYVVEFGRVDQIDTTVYTSTAGTILWFDSEGTVAGAITETEPAPPAVKIQVAAVIRLHQNEGSLFVRPTWYHELGELHDVNITSAADKDLLTYNSSTGVWENSKTLGDITTGNITTSGTVDGVDISDFKTAYDSHNHDDRYYTETEIDTLLTNSTNWDTAYSWGDHAGLYSLLGHTHTESEITDFGNYVTGITHDTVNTKLVVTNRDATTVDLSLAQYVDDTNLARLVSGTVNISTGIATFTRDDATTFDVDFSALLDDTNDYVTSASFNTSDGVLTLTRFGGATVTVNLDDRYLTSAFIEDKGTYTSDLDALTASGDQGWYAWGSTQPTNSPGWNYGGVFVIRDSSQNLQLAFGGSGDNNQRIAVRRADSGSYGPWTEFYSTADFSTTDISNWNTAYGWGDHASAGYAAASSLSDYLPLAGGTMSGNINAGGNKITNLHSIVLNNEETTDLTQDGQIAYDLNDSSAPASLGTYGGSYPDGLYMYGNSTAYRIYHTGHFSGTNISNWETAYGWGNHASAGYITGYTETQTLDDVTTLGASTTNTISVGRVNLGSTSDSSFLAGSSKLSADGYVMVNGIVNTSETGTGPAAIVFGNGSTYGSDQISFVTSGITRIFIDTNSVDVSAQLNMSADIDMGTNTITDTKVGQWDTAYGWGNHASAGYLTSFDITTQTDPKYLRSDANDTASGVYTFTGQINLTQTANTIGGATISNGSLVIGDNTQGIGIDNNEIHSAGVLYIGTNSGNLVLRPAGSVVDVSGNRFLTTADEGSGNGIDADTVDGVQASSFTLRSDDYFKPFAELGSAVNLNDFRTSGYASQNSNAQAAAGSNYPTAFAGMFEVVNDDTGNGLHTTQRYSQYNTNNFYARNYYSGTWTSWTRFLTTDDEGSGNGIDADTVDGIQAASFLRSDTADTASGTITFSSIYSGGTGDFTNLSNPSYKVSAGSGYWRIPHISSSSVTSGVYNFETGKSVYWGEPGDTGDYRFRGRRLFGENGVQAPTYYALTNTGYYVDPAGTSNLNAATFANSITANGHIYGRSVNGQYSNLYRMGGVYFTWDSDSYGTNFEHSITSTFGGSYGDHLTINSYGHVKINIDSNGNGSNTFSVGRHTTGDANNMMVLDESSNMTVYGSVRSPIFYDSDNTGYYLNPASTSNLNAATFAGDITVSGNQVITNGVSADVKFSVWSGTTYGIGMTSGVTLGGLNDYAMTFCMNNDTDRGFWWGYSGQAKSAGAMSLTTSGHLTVTSRVDAPIFYDSNDTNSYFDGGSGDITLRGDSPTIYFRDTNHNSGMIHVNSDRLYILRGGDDSRTWTQVGGQWPAYWQLNTNQLVGGGAASFVGDVTANTSDRRLKENIKNIPDAIEKVKSLNGVTFDWKDNLEEIHYTRQRIHDVGVIAQEVQAVLPDAVRPAPFDTDEQGNSRSGENYLTVQYEKIVPLLIEAVKELSNKVEELENKLNGTN